MLMSTKFSKLDCLKLRYKKVKSFYNGDHRIIHNHWKSSKLLFWNWEEIIDVFNIPLQWQRQQQQRQQFFRHSGTFIFLFLLGWWVIWLLPLQNYATSNNVTIVYFSVIVIFLGEVVDWDRVEQIIPWIPMGQQYRYQETTNKEKDEEDKERRRQLPKGKNRKPCKNLGQW